MGHVLNGFAIAVSLGAALALPYVLYARRASNRRRIYGAGLVIAAAVYVGFAAFAGTLNELFVELAGVIVFGIAAFSGIRHSPYILALGWLAHVSWDLLLHPISGSSYAPWWYPVLCIGFDLVVAGAIVGAKERA